MDWWRRLFGRRPPAQVDESVSPKVAETIAALKARGEACLRLVGGEDGGSRLGGVPDMAGAWPRYEGRPLCCVAQLDLAEIRSASGPEWLPDQGRLLFFYELEHGSWGLYAKDAGSAVVIHENGFPVVATEPDDLPYEARFPAYPVSFRRGISYPTEERLVVDWGRLNVASTDALEEALADLAPAAPMHQIGGYPCPVQSDSMEAECHDIARRLGQPSDVADWRLLLQLDTDDDAGMMWGDVGSLYFWIRQQDARAGDFSKIWMILQCH
jgi:uncharacterized protein YwqG